MSLKIINVVGARPNFMKVAPLMNAYAARPELVPVLVHTGQHYDRRMSDVFFTELGIPMPDVNLGVGSGSHAKQTAEIMTAFEPVLLEQKADAVVVVGDVNSTIACGLVAVKLGVKLVHVEAGLRSFDRSMPEEINRVLTDAISDLLFCTEESGVANLLHEGISSEKVHFVGNLMIDTLLKHKAAADRSDVLSRVGVTRGAYAVLTLHRPSNVDSVAVLYRLLSAIEVIQRDLPIVFPVHPRTRKMLASAEMGADVARMSNIRIIDPLGYLDFVKLLSDAKFALTDSGGIQEETTVLGVPCLTLRENTERPSTVASGSNILVGTDPEQILHGYRRVLTNDVARNRLPPLWDGNAADRTVNIMCKML